MAERLSTAERIRRLARMGSRAIVSRAKAEAMSALPALEVSAGAVSSRWRVQGERLMSKTQVQAAKAFPMYAHGTGDWQPGMDLRDWFAGMALQASHDRTTNADHIAVACYRAADAMMKVRAEKPKELA